MIAIGEYTITVVNDGATGPQGPQGISVAKVVREYTKSSSPSTLPSNPSWSETEPTIGANEYLWARDRTDLSDGTSTYGPAICSTNISGIKHDVDKANKSITDKVWESDITTKINSYDNSTVSTIRDRVSQTETDIDGITSRVSDVESVTDDLGTRMSTAETTIDQTANNVLIKATKSDTTAAQGGQHLIESLINVAPSGVTISADKVDIEGATIFSSGRLSQTSLNNAYDAKGAAATVQTNLDNLEIGGRNLLLSSANMRNNKHSSSGGTIEFIDDYAKITTTSKGWYDFMLSTKCRDLDLIKDAKSLAISLDVKMENAGSGALYVEIITVSNDNLGSRVRFDSQTIYISSNFPTEWTRVNGIASADRSTWVKNNDNTEIGVTAHIYWYNTGTVYIKKPKLEIGNKPTSWTPAPEDVEADIANAQTTANSATKTTVPVYYRSTTNSTPSISSSTSISTSNNADNTWTYTMPLPKKNAYFYICEEYTSVSGTKTFSTVRKLDSQTYASKWVSSNDNTLIDGGSIYAHSITSSQLATDAIKSTNYQAAASGPYSVTGTFLDLSNGNFYTPNFGVQSLTGQAYLNGEIIATSGSIGDDSGNYWSIGNTIDSQGNGSASIVGNGTAFIQDGDWQIHSGLSNYSNGSINTQWYIQPQGQGLQLTYPYYDGYYYDYGMTSPVLDANSDRFYNQTVSQNFLYIRKHASTIPALESDWDYIFRIDKDGMIWINGQSLTQMIEAGVDGGAYLPTSGGTVNGNVTITGTLTATASKANQLTHTLSINGKGFDGSGDVNVGTIGAAYGGTGQTSLINSANALLNALSTGSDIPKDNDYYISQYVNGGTSTTTYHRRPVSKLWDYIKSKLSADHSALDSSYVLKSGDTITGSLTVENGIYSDSAQLGDLIVTGAGRFANGLYGDLIGNADTATKAAKVADIGNGTETTFAYSKTGLTTTSWIAAWNNYELRAISPANLLTTIGADKSASISDRINVTSSGSYNWTNSTYDDKLITSNTLAYWNGAYNSSSHASNIEYVKAGKLGDIVTHNASEFLTTSGNAASSSKFNSTRTISLTGDVTGSASSDGSSGWSIATTVQDNSHNHTPNNIIPGQMGLAGNLDPLTRAMIGSTASNKTFGLPANAITIEYSTDGGSTWKDYGATDSHKKALFMELRTGCSTYLGKATTKEANSLNNQLRVTIEPVDRYVGLDALYIWMATCGNTVTVDLERSTIGAKDTYTTVFTGQALAGWSGNNIRYFTYGSFGGGSGQTSNYYKYRLTFKQTAINSNYPSANIYDIRFLGMNVHSTANNIVTANHLYTWDTDFNAIFPAGITATSFTGNASSASKLNSTRSFTIGKTAKNVDWSGAVSFTKAEISDDASSTTNGWMSVADKKKLDSITVSDIGTIGANSIRGEKDIKVTISSGIATIGHENAAITAGTISGTATSTLSNGGSFKIPSITYDAYGHITGTAQTTVTLPNITSVSGNAGTATKFSSARAISLSGDVSGSATTDGSSGWSITTTVKDDSHNHTVDTIKPKLTKTYTGIIATENNQNEGNFYFFKVVPESYGNKWSIHYRVYAEIAGVSDENGNGKQFSDVYVSGVRNTYLTYRTWNDIAHTSYRPYYYHCMYRAGESVISQGHGFGLALRSSYNRTTAANSRTVTFEIVDYDGCTVSFLDNPVTYDNWPGYSTSTFVGITEFDATTQGNTMSGDRNDVNYQHREQYASRTAHSFIGRYMMVLSRNDGTIIPTVTVDNNITTTKTYNTTDEFDPFGGIFYYYGSSTAAAGGNVPNGYLYDQFMMDLRYAFNVGGNNTDSLITAREPFYLVATPQSNGMAKIHSSGYTQTLPTSDDGLIYIYLGMVYEDAKPWRLNLTINHPVYWYKNGAVRQFTGVETGTTFTGAVNFANNTLNLVGDDAYLGDQNVSGCIAIKGKNGATGIQFVPYSGSTSQKISIDGAGNMTITGNIVGDATGTLGSTAKPFHQLVLGGATTATVDATSTNPRITFQEGTGTQPVHLIYSDYDSYRSPAGLKICGGSSASPAWLEVEGTIYAPTFSGTATKATADASGNTITSTYVNLTGTQTISGAKTFSTMPLSSAGICVNSSGSGTVGGVSLWSDKTVENYGMALRATSNGGKHGFVQGDYATYNYMYAASDAASLTRGWVFKNNRVSKNVASISGEGDVAFNGEVAIGTTGTDISGSVSLVMDHDLNCLNFIFN